MVTAGEQTTPQRTAPPSKDEVLASLGGGHRGRWWRRLAWLLGLALLAGGGYAAWTLLQTPEPPPAWRTATVDRGDIVVVVSATGRVEAVRTVEVGAEISGKITAVEADYNDRVTAGQVLARIDTEKLQAQLEQAEAQLDGATAQVRQARATRTETKAALARLETLAAKGVSSAEQLEGAKAGYARASAALAGANADLRLAEARVETAKTDLGKAVITSPVDGVVLQRMVEPGNTVAASLQAPVLFLLAEDLERMVVYADIDEADVGRVAEGQAATFTVDAFTGRTFEASVKQVRLAPTTTGDVVTYTALLEVANTDRLLRPGMTATASVTTAADAGVLRVPNAALRFTPPAVVAEREAGRGFSMMPRRPRGGGGAKRAGGSVAWVLRDGQPVRVVLATGATDGRFTELKGDELAEGDTVLTGVEQPEAK